jgi:hypothetical protein
MHVPAPARSRRWPREPGAAHESAPILVSKLGGDVTFKGFQAFLTLRF